MIQYTPKSVFDRIAELERQVAELRRALDAMLASLDGASAS